MKKLTLLSGIVLSAALAATPVIGQDFKPFVTVGYFNTDERGVYDADLPITDGFITKYLVDETGVFTADADNGNLIRTTSLPSSIPTIDLSGLKFGGEGALTGMGLRLLPESFIPFHLA